MIYSTVVSSLVTLDNTGQCIELPVVVTKDGVLTQHLKFLVRNRQMSASWKNKAVYSIRLLIDYLIVNNEVFKSNLEMFESFVINLVTGTTDAKGRDPSQLYWKPRHISDSKFILHLLNQFTDYLAEFNEGNFQYLNQHREASVYETKLNWAINEQRKKRSFLSHLWSIDNSKNSLNKVRVVEIKKKVISNSIHNDIKAFPSDKINLLLYSGFNVQKSLSSNPDLNNLNLRDILITMLMHFGGLRISEVMHIYLHDIQLINSELIVKVHHPIFGLSPSKVYKTRKEFLLHQYGLIPRNELSSSKKQFAGWKEPLLTNSRDNYFIVHWFPASTADTFLELWKAYLKYQRKFPLKGFEHPYAFTSSSGSPYSIKSYRSALKQATERIGLNYGYEYSTSPHSHRHRYGLNLSEGRVPEMVIKNAMHHKSIESQHVYTQPTAEIMKKELANAEDILKNKKQ